MNLNLVSYREEESQTQELSLLLSGTDQRYVEFLGIGFQNKAHRLPQIIARPVEPFLSAKSSSQKLFQILFKKCDRRPFEI